MIVKASDLFTCKVGASNIGVDSGVLLESADDGVLAQEFIADLINKALDEEQQHG